MTASIAVVCEATADKRTGCDLADRVIYEQADWITPQVIDNYRTYRGYREQDEYFAWKDVRSIAGSLGIRAHGWFDGDPGAPDALATRRALLVLKSASLPADAVILLRDSDNQVRRADGINQARAESEQHWTAPIVVGIAHTKRECWILVGFVPENAEEESSLQALSDGTALGFNPTLSAERLTAKTSSAKKNAKRVLSNLTGDDNERESRCWLETPLADLETRGEAVGLSAYVREIRNRLISLFR